MGLSTNERLATVNSALFRACAVPAGAPAACGSAAGSSPAGVDHAVMRPCE